MDISHYGYNSSELVQGEIPARITAVYGERWAAVCDEGDIYLRLKGSYFKQGSGMPTTGDFVAIRYNPSGDSLITRLLPRHSYFLRSNFMGHALGYAKTIKEQVVAANFDYVFVMQSLNADFSPRRLERYLALAWRSGAVPVVILTKADLCPDAAPLVAQAIEASPGVQVHTVSVVSGFGMDEVAKYFEPGKTLVFLGSSGVGKSTLVNALAGAEVMDTAGIRLQDDEGRHTTTRRQLICLPGGAMVIDTPGMREIGLFDAAEGITKGFPDVEALLGKCRYADCRHKNEPGCAIKAALASGELTATRWESYVALTGEDAFVKRHTKREKLQMKIKGR